MVAAAQRGMQEQVVLVALALQVLLKVAMGWLQPRPAAAVAAEKEVGTRRERVLPSQAVAAGGLDCLESGRPAPGVLRTQRAGKVAKVVAAATV